MTWGSLLTTSQLNVYQGNPRQGYCFLSQFSFNKARTRIQGYEDQDSCFVVALKRAVWNVLAMACFNFFLEFFFGGVQDSVMSMLTIEGLQCTLQVCCGENYLERPQTMRHVVL